MIREACQKTMWDLVLRRIDEVPIRRPSVTSHMLEDRGVARWLTAPYTKTTSIGLRP